MRILGLIPARGGSKGIPRKNIKLLHGKELIRHTIETGLACSAITQLVVSTDDEEIAQISKAAGAEVPFLRPSELANDKAPTIDTVVHALKYFEEKSEPFDAVCLLQPTVPFRNGMDLSNAIQKFNNQEASSLISVREVPHVYNPYWVFEQDANSGFLKLSKERKKIIARRQDLPKSFYRDGAVYITRKEVVLNEYSLYGKKVIHHIMQHSPNINIDTMEDWNAAITYAKENLAINS